MTRMDEPVPRGRAVFTGRRVQLRLVEVPLGDGQSAERELVVHPGAVVVLALTDADERIRVEVLPLHRIRRMMPAGEIVDAKTLAAIGLYLLKRNG